MEYKVLNKVNGPEDLKGLSRDEIPILIDEIRDFLLDKVGKNGGHLASNLGVVELTVALHRVFDSPKDHIIFDVGHQAYVHKILTGRKDSFDELRKPGGLSGFTTRREGAHDPFGAGHSSTSISAALGFAESDLIAGSDASTVCVIGDGAYTGGMAHEAINNCRPELPMVIVLNENGMSISTNKGRFASYLSGVRSSARYQGAKKGTISVLGKIPLLGFLFKLILSFGKSVIKWLLFKPNYFEQLGFFYMGPIDGNDYKKVEKALTRAKELRRCVILHVKTKKGKGLDKAEAHPDEFHSIAASGHVAETYHSVFAEELIKHAENDSKILAVTAAMGIGTGLDNFERAYPDRCFDVGIAEEHALTFSAGLAANGFKPYAAIYSTFLQRGYDNIIHDIALQGLPVRLMIDRAGIAASDGATHHGIFDVAFLSHIPGIEILSPATFGSLRQCISYSVNCDHPIAIRYPNATEKARVVDSFYRDGDYSSFGIRRDYDHHTELVAISYGQTVDNVLGAKQLLAEKGIELGVVLAERLKPMDKLVELTKELLEQGCRVFFVEEGIKNGGAAMLLRSALTDLGVDGVQRLHIFAIDDNFVIPDSFCSVYDYAGLSSLRIAERIMVLKDDN